ncbi:MAG: DNA adenine methylase [Candidatus Kapabacteria bacterium]|nr:DNA adenine methylase [Candidatus Kapabacteria bacterium]
MSKNLQILTYPGGKGQMTDWIISQLPKHRVYVEPFCGSAAVLLNKPVVQMEVLNDVFSEIATLFMVLRDAPEQLAALIQFTPYSYEEFYAATTLEPYMTPLEQARRMLIRSYMGYGSKATQYHSTGFRRPSLQTWFNAIEQWRDLPGLVFDVSERLKRCVIESCDAIECMKRWDTPDTLIYADPPYMPSTLRHKAGLYKHMMTPEQHEQMLNFLTTCDSKVIVSGYHSELYDDYLHTWRISTRTTHTQANTQATEVLWFSPSCESNQLSFIT